MEVIALGPHFPFEHKLAREQFSRCGGKLGVLEWPMSQANPKLSQQRGGNSVPAYVTEYLANCMPLSEAQRYWGFTRTSFFRFRHLHRINTLLRGRVCQHDIVCALEKERGREKVGSHTEDPAIYRTKLLTLPEAMQVFGLAATSFWRLRVRHKIPTLSGGFVHVDDVLAALDVERMKPLPNLLAAKRESNTRRSRTA